MANCIFRVDVSPEDGDFQAVATEPGLPMIDRTNTNYGILREWFGNLIAEPQWQGENLVGFFVQDEDRGQLEDVECVPCSQSDMKGVLKAEVEELQARLKRIRPKTSNEELLLRIVRKTINEQLKDIETSDFDCYFFKCRPKNEPWRLVWCWGFQRADLQPAPGVICTNFDCHHLFVRRGRGRPRCPVCMKHVIPKKKPGMTGYVRDHWMSLLLLLLLLCGLLGYFGWPRVAVEPGQWAGPVGSKVTFDVKYKYWIFFSDDVTDMCAAQSHDRRKLDFGEYGTTARAKMVGQTQVTFYYNGYQTMINATVDPPSPPDSLRITPEKPPTLGIGSTCQLTVMGTYNTGTEEEREIDVTDAIEWKMSEEDITTIRRARLQGANPGTTNVTASYPVKKDATPPTASVDVKVIEVEYTELFVKVEPEKFPVNHAGQINVYANDADKNEYSFVGSTLMDMSVSPASIGELDRDEFSVLGKTQGTADLEVFMSEPAGTLKASCQFTVGEGMGDMFLVTPESLDLKVSEEYQLTVGSTSTEPVELITSDESIAKVVGNDTVIGVGPGLATVTVKQGENTIEVPVVVTQSMYVRLAFNPEQFSMAVGDDAGINVVGVEADGSQVLISPSELTWEKQPSQNIASIDREQGIISAIGQTIVPQEIRVRHEDLTATALVTVTGGANVLAMDNDVWGVHPPIGWGDRVTGLSSEIVGSNSGVILDSPGIARVIGEGGILPEGTTITGVDGRLLRDLPAPEVARLIQGIRPGMRIDTPGGPIYIPGEFIPGVFVQFVDVDATNLTETSFDASFTLQVLEPGQYRIIGVGGNPISEWVTTGPKSMIKIPASGVSKTGNHRYKLQVEHQSASGGSALYELQFKLDPAASGPSGGMTTDEVGKAAAGFDAGIPGDDIIPDSETALERAGVGQPPPPDE